MEPPQDPHSSQGLMIGGTAPIGPEIVKPTPRYVTPGSNKGHRTASFATVDDSGCFLLHHGSAWFHLTIGVE